MADTPWITDLAFSWYEGGVGSPVNGIYWGVPPGAVKYDIIVTCAWIRNWNPSLTPPSGMTKITSTFDGNLSRTFFWHRNGVDSPVGNITNTGDYKIRGSYCVAIRGCVRTGTPFESGTWGTYASFSSSHNIPGLTTAGTNRLCVDFGLHYANTTCSDNATSYSEDKDYPWTAGSVTIGVYDYEKLTAGSVSSDSYSLGTSCGNRGWATAFIPDGVYYPVFLRDDYIRYSTSTALTVSYAPYDKDEDIAFVLTIMKHATATCATPSGWNLASGPSRISSPALTAYLFWRRLVGTEGFSQVFTWNTSGSKWGGMTLVEKTVDTGTPWDGSVQVSQEDPASSTVNIAALTTSGSYRLCLNFSVVNSNRWANNNATDYVESSDRGNTSGTDCRMAVYGQEVLSSGSVATDSYTISASDISINFALPLIPFEVPGFAHKVVGVAGANIEEVIVVASANISKLIGV